MFQAWYLVALLPGLSSAFNYCSISDRNTLCRYKANEFGPSCKEPFRIDVTDSDKSALVGMHNALRRHVAKGHEKRGNPGPQPPAANMRKLIWDDELAEMAQAWANQCTFQHDESRDVSRFPVGQNLFISMSSAPSKKADWSSAINGTDRSWFNEVTDVNKAYVHAFPESATKVIGHYTALFWAETTRLGCGATGFTSKDHHSVPHQIIYVCNYGKAGNWIGAPIYKTGPPASACPKGTTPVDGLCS